MHQEPPHGAHVIHAKRGGGGWKWLAGAAVAALLVGGGYYAYTNSAPQPAPQSELAANAPTPAAPIERDVAADETAQDPSDDAALPDASTPAPATAPASRRAAAHAATSVPEQIVGVTPASMTTEGDEIVIPGVRRPIWVRTPSAYRLASLYPERALERGREGEASVHCTVQENGALDCVQVSETPANAGFGNAALRVARTFRHAPQLADGSAAAGTPVNLRVIFRMADERRHG
ncbi:MAG TPA: TonB family protein [Caulobacterales bacterium]|nr:TonB family protein [Caulobacterales bacterium]